MYSLKVNNQFYVICKNSSKTGNRYVALVCRVGSYLKYLSFDRRFICDLLDCKPSELEATIIDFDCGDLV